MAALEFGEKLKKERTAKGQSQTELGEILGVGLKQVQRYEKGEVLPDHDKVRQLIEIYDVDFVSIIYDVPRKTPSRPVTEKYEKVMEERVLELKEDKDWLKRTLELSLTGISVQAASILAYVSTSLEKDDEREAGQDEQKLRRLRTDTGKRIGEKMGAGVKNDTKIAGK